MYHLITGSPLFDSSARNPELELQEIREKNIEGLVSTSLKYYYFD